MVFVFANVLQPLIDAAKAVLDFFHNSVGFGWGASIIALTVLVRLVLLPLTVKQFHSMQKMQVLAPQMKALQAKYKEDKQRLQQEMMKLYREHNVNPFGSCLPLVAQLPVFVSLFYMLRSDLRRDICHQVGGALVKHVSGHTSTTVCTNAAAYHHDVRFLFIPDLTTSAHGVVLVVLLVLYVASQLGSTLLMPTGVDPNQRRMMMLLPLVFTLFVARFPAGLLVYWITTNIWTVAQQYTIRRFVGPVPVPAAATTGDGRASRGLGGLFGSLRGQAAVTDKPAGAAALGAGGSGTKRAPDSQRGTGSTNGAKGESADKAQGVAGGKAQGVAGGKGATQPRSAPGSGPPPPSPRKRKRRSGRRR